MKDFFKYVAQIILTMFGISLIAFYFIDPVAAQTMPSNQDAGAILNKLLLEREGLSKWALAMLIVILSAQFLKWQSLKPFYEWLNKTLGKKSEKIIKQLVVALLGYIYTTLFLIENGTKELEAIITTLTGGGALAIYSVVKNIWGKKDE